MYHRQYPTRPSQQAVTGALDIFVGGGKRARVSEMLFGLTVLRDATEDQLSAAMPFVQRSQSVSELEIRGMLAG